MSKNRIYAPLAPGEQVLWFHRVSKGFIHKEVAEEWIITNTRALKHFLVTKQNSTPRTAYVNLVESSSVVMNQRRTSQANRVGNFVGTGSSSGFAGVTGGSSRSTSGNFGDLVFFLNGKEVLCFQGISDPNGVHKMIETVKRQTKSFIK